MGLRACGLKGLRALGLKGLRSCGFEGLRCLMKQYLKHWCSPGYPGYTSNDPPGNVMLKTLRSGRKTG